MALQEQELIPSCSSTSTKSSQRVGSVWERRLDKGSPDSHNPVMSGSASSSRSTKEQEYRVRRQEAALFIESQTGESIPYTSSQEFKAALVNGVALCKILNVVKPGTIPKIIEAAPVESAGTTSTIQLLENVHNFLSEAGEVVPTECRFSLSDLKGEGDGRQVIDCILFLKKCHEEKPRAGSAGGSEICSLSSPQKHLLSSRMNGRAHHVSSPPPAAAPHPGASLVSAAQKGHQLESGVTRLIKNLTVLLQNRMDGSSVSSKPILSAEPTTADGIGPILETVLNNLTQEYERRLQTKDHEISATRENMQKMEKQMAKIQEQLAALYGELEQAKVSGAQEVSQGLQEEVESLKKQLAELEEKLRQRDTAYMALSERLVQQEEEKSSYEEQLQQAVAPYISQLDSLKHVESSYKSILDENKKLYNQVQDLRGSIRVFCRVRPCGKTGDSSAGCIDIADDGELAIYDGKGKRKVFKFDHVFAENVTQPEVYGDTQALIRSVLDGFNVCIFAYGQTGSGKTHTMSGTDIQTPEGRGINYRALDDLFALKMERSREEEYSIKVQMLEIYNETLRDLLVADSSSSSNKLDILNTQASGCNVPGATQVEVHNPEDVIALMARGAKNRATAGTNMNERSSRSHQILTVVVDGKNLVTGITSHGCLHLVDLAGSEKTMKSGAQGDRMVEACNINTSLTMLGTVMKALAQKQAHVPFRNSKLTQLLADSLSGQAKVMMFVHVAPEVSSFSESQSTLTFASNVSEITLGQAQKNTSSAEVFKAHEELARLKAEVKAERQQKEDYARQIAQLQAQMESMKQGQATTPSTPYESAASLTVESTRSISKLNLRDALFSEINLTPQSAAPQAAGTPRTGTPMQTIVEDTAPQYDTTTPRSRLAMSKSVPRPYRPPAGDPKPVSNLAAAALATKTTINSAAARSLSATRPRTAGPISSRLSLETVSRIPTTRAVSAGGFSTPPPGASSATSGRSSSRQSSLYRSNTARTAGTYSAGLSRSNSVPIPASAGGKRSDGQWR